MLNLAIAPLIKKARARTSDPVQLAVISLLEMLCTDISAGERKRACATCRKQYRLELKRTAAWKQKHGYKSPPKTKARNSAS
jgi:hypothetical protein